MKKGLDVMRERGIDITRKVINATEFDKAGLPMVVRCTGCGMTMSLPSAYVDEEGYTWCARCAHKNETAQYEEQEQKIRPLLLESSTDELVEIIIQVGSKEAMNAATNAGDGYPYNAPREKLLAIIDNYHVPYWQFFEGA